VRWCIVKLLGDTHFLSQILQTNGFSPAPAGLRGRGDRDGDRDDIFGGGGAFFLFFDVGVVFLFFIFYFFADFFLKTKKSFVLVSIYKIYCSSVSSSFFWAVIPAVSLWGVCSYFFPGIQVLRDHREHTDSYPISRAGTYVVGARDEGCEMNTQGVSYLFTSGMFLFMYFWEKTKFHYGKNRRIRFVHLSPCGRSLDFLVKKNKKLKIFKTIKSFYFFMGTYFCLSKQQNTSLYGSCLLMLLSFFYWNISLTCFCRHFHLLNSSSSSSWMVWMPMSPMRLNVLYISLINLAGAILYRQDLFFFYSILGILCNQTSTEEVL